MNMIKLAIMLISLIGLALVGYNYRKRTKEGAIDKDTGLGKEKEIDATHHIDNLLFLEKPLELFVLAYFGIVLLSYIGMMIAQAVVPGLYLAVLYLSGIVFFLLGYKALMQKGVSAQVNSWILFSLPLSLAIMFLAYYGLEMGLIPLLRDAEQYSLTVHILGVVLGLGATLVVDIMFIHFLGNLRISKKESIVMHLLSQMIMLGLILLILSGIALFLTDVEGYLNSPRFLMKMTVVLVAILNGGALNLYITPKMEKISMRKGEERRNEGFKSIAFALGGISIVSWLSAYFLAMIKDLSAFSYLTMFSVYVGLLLITFIGSQIARKQYQKEAEAS
jgi:hypothetical protein